MIGLAQRRVRLRAAKLWHGGRAPLSVAANTPARAMPRLRYAGLYDPDRIPMISQEVRTRPDVQGYRDAVAPKAAAIHPLGRLYVITGAPSQRLAEARALGACRAAFATDSLRAPCYLYAVGDQVVLAALHVEPRTPALSAGSGIPSAKPGRPPSNRTEVEGIRLLERMQ